MNAPFLSAKLSIFMLFAATLANGQVATTTQTLPSQENAVMDVKTPPSDATLQAFAAEQRSLYFQEQSLVRKGASQKEIAEWRAQNAAAFAQQRQRANALAMASALALLPENRKATIPADAPIGLVNFLTTQTALVNAKAHIHNQVVQQATASGQKLTPQQLNKLKEQESSLFQKQNSELLALQAQRARTLSNISLQSVRSLPAPIVIPENATPPMAAYLKVRSQLRRGMAQVVKQYAGATPADRDKAIQAWSKANSGQLEASASTLSNTVAAPSN